MFGAFLDNETFPLSSGVYFCNFLLTFPPLCTGTYALLICNDTNKISHPDQEST